MPAQEQRQQTESGLERLPNGRWLDPSTGHTFNPHRTQRPDILAAEENFQASSVNWANLIAPQARDAQRYEMEEERAKSDQQQRRDQAAMIQDRLPTSIAILSERRAQIEAEMANDPMTTPEDREKAIMARLAGDPAMRPHVQFMESVNGFMEENPGLIDPQAFAPAPVGDDNTIASFAEQVGDDGSLPAPAQGQQQGEFNRLPTTHEARRELEGLQSQLPDGTPEERRRFAQETKMEDGTTLADNIVKIHNFVQTRQQHEGDLGITPATLDESGNPVNKPLTPAERGFIPLPGGGYQRGNTIGGVPGLAVMNDLAREGYAPPAREYQGQIVGDNQQFGQVPEGFTRNAVGVPGGGTVVADQARDPNAPRYGVFQNADGSFTGMGATDDANQRFATEQEAREWSIANFTPKPPIEQQPIQQPGQNNNARSLLAGSGGSTPPTGQFPRLPTANERTANHVGGREMAPTFAQERADPLSGPSSFVNFFRHLATVNHDRYKPQTQAVGPSGYVSPAPNPNAQPQGGFTGQQATNLLSEFRGVPRSQQRHPSQDPDFNRPSFATQGVPPRPPSGGFTRIPQQRSENPSMVTPSWFPWGGSSIPSNRQERSFAGSSKPQTTFTRLPRGDERREFGQF